MKKVRKKVISADFYGVDIEKQDNLRNFIKFKYADIEKGLPYPNEFFDIISMNEFIEHILNDLQIERIDNSGHYEKGNIKLTTAKEQANNRRKRKES